MVAIPAVLGEFFALVVRLAILFLGERLCPTGVDADFVVDRTRSFSVGFLVHTGSFSSAVSSVLFARMYLTGADVALWLSRFAGSATSPRSSLSVFSLSHCFLTFLTSVGFFAFIAYLGFLASLVFCYSYSSLAHLTPLVGFITLFG